MILFSIENMFGYLKHKLKEHIIESNEQIVKESCKILFSLD